MPAESVDVISQSLKKKNDFRPRLLIRRLLEDFFTRLRRQCSLRLTQRFDMFENSVNSLAHASCRLRVSTYELRGQLNRLLPFSFR